MGDRISKEALKEKVGKFAYDYELEYHGCSQAVLLAFQEDLDLDASALRAASPLVGGLGTGGTCAALTAGVMVLGLKYGRSRVQDGIMGLVPGLAPTQALVKTFEQEFGSSSCWDMVRVDWRDAEAAMAAIMDPEFLKKCAHISGRTAEMVADIIGDDM